MKDIAISEKGIECLRAVERLWYKLNQHHSDVSIHFKEEINNRGFDYKINGINRKADNRDVKIFLATDTNISEVIGYCIGIISGGTTKRDKKTGEVDSLFVEKKYRKNGIGADLMKKCISWFKKEAVQELLVDVAAGNEQSISFYEKFDFRLKSHLLKQKK